MANTIYITAGLPVAKNADQNPEGTNTAYITAGLPPQILESEEPIESTRYFALQTSIGAFAFQT